MRNTFQIIIIVISFLVVSCNSNEISELNTKIEKLELENKKLRDSISKSDYNKILQTQILGSFDKPFAKVNEEINLSLQFCNQNFYSTYELFKINLENNERELIKEANGGLINYRFTPKSINDNRVKFLAVFDLDSTVIEIPADIGFEIKN